MFEVKIFIETSLQGPCTKKGQHIALIEYMKKNGEPETREVYGEVEETTFHESALVAAVEGLRILKKPCIATIHTNCPYLKNTVERGSLETWKKNDWMKSSGEEVKHKELWQEFLEMMDKHKIAFQFSKHHEYKSYLQSKMAEKAVEAKKNDDI